jgi:hypothetical protein
VNSPSSVTEAYAAAAEDAIAAAERVRDGWVAAGDTTRAPPAERLIGQKSAIKKAAGKR